MPKVARAHIAYRYESFSFSDTEDGGAVVNLDKVVPIPAVPRHLDWERILKYVLDDDRRIVQELILEHHLDLFIDDDHQVVIDEEGTLRFRPVPGADVIRNYIDFNRAALDFSKGNFTLSDYRDVYRSIGYSLYRFGELCALGDHAHFERTLTEDGHHVIEEHCPVWMLQ